MNTKERNALVKETKALIKEVEAGQPEHAAWVAIQDRVRQLHAEVGSNRKVGKLIGKGETWVRDVLRWDARDRARPFGGEAKNALRYEQNERTVARKVLTDPEKRKQAIELIAKDDPSVAAEIAKAAIEQTADEQAATEVATEAFNRSAAIRQGGRKYPKKTKTTGAFEGWLKVSSRIDSAKYQAKLALKELQSIDTPIADDLREELLRDLDTLDAAWELVLAAVKGETVGDQAEEFLARLAAEE